MKPLVLVPLLVTLTASCSAGRAPEVPGDVTDAAVGTEAGDVGAPGNADGPGDAGADRPDGPAPTTCAPIDLVSNYIGEFAGVRADGLGVSWNERVAPRGGPFLKYDAQCGLYQDRTITCWTPFSSMSRPGTFQTFVAMREVACGIHTDGTIECWRFDASGFDPVPTPPAGTFTRMAGAADHLCAVRTDGEIRCWQPSSLPGNAIPESPFGGGPYVDLSMGTDYVCGIRASGTYECWSALVSPRARGLQTDTTATMAFDSLVFGAAYRCGLRKDGSVYCWGSLAGKAPSGRFVQIAGGEYTPCGVRADGVVVCWSDSQTIAPPAGFGCCRQPFEDDFSKDPRVGNSPPPNWQWSETDGTFTLSAPTDTGADPATFTFHDAWRNFRVRTRMKVDSGTDAGVIFRWNGAGHYVGLYPAEKKLKLMAILASRTVLAEADVDIAPGAYHDLEITALGCTLTGTLDGTTKVTANSNLIARSGDVGFFADLGATATFDAISIQCLDGDVCAVP